MNIESLFDDLGVVYSRTGKHARDGWVQLKVCPFCDSHNYHLGWNLQGNFTSCWRCGWHSAWNVLKSLGVSHQRIKEALNSIDTFPTQKPVSSQSVSLKLPSGRSSLQAAHKQYLSERGFDWKKLVQVWRIEGIGIHPELAWRIFLPIVYRGKVVSWTTRAIGERVTQRYISASQGQEVVSHKHLAYGIDYCRHSVVICEGPTDAWAIGPGAVALFGTAFTSAQVRLLVEIPNRFICFDSAEEAQAKAVKLAGQLSCFPGVTENLMIDSKDPGVASEKELSLIRRTAKIG